MPKKTTKTNAKIYHVSVKEHKTGKNNDPHFDLPGNLSCNRFHFNQKKAEVHILHRQEGAILLEFAKDVADTNMLPQS